MAPAEAVLDFGSDLLAFDHTLSFVQKCLKSAESNPIFNLKGRRDRALTSASLDFTKSLTLDFLLSSILPGNTWNHGMEIWPKKEILGPPYFYKNSDFGDITETMFFSANILSLVKITKDPKKTEKVLFHGCWIITQNFEKF